MKRSIWTDKRWNNYGEKEALLAGCCKPYFQSAATAAFVIVGLKAIRFLMPFVIGWIISAIATPLVNWLEKRLKIVKKLGSALIVIVVLALIILVLYFAISRISTEIGDLVKNFPDMYAQLEQGLRQIGSTLSGHFPNCRKESRMDGIPSC